MRAVQGHAWRRRRRRRTGPADQSRAWPFASGLPRIIAPAVRRRGQTGTRAEHPARRRARPGRRRAARRRRWPSVGRAGLRRLRARAVLRQPVRLLRLQHLHRRPSWAAAAPDGLVRRRRAGRDRPGRAGARRRGARGWTRSSSAAARRRCCPPDDLARILDGLDRAFGLAADAEVTTEANPESVDPAAAGAACARPASPGSRSACSRPRRTCSPCSTAGTRRAGPPRPRSEAREAGFDHVNLDLIYGTPGETRRGLRRLAAGRRRGRGGPRLGVLADRRGRHPAGRPGPARRGADARRRRRRRPLPRRRGGARRRPGFAWYEVSNWARVGGRGCRHNLLYWRGGDWWGFGPGAHSHVGGVRWWNVKHPIDVRPAAGAPGPRPAHGPGGAGGRRAAHRGGHAAAAAGRGAAAGRA